MKPPRYRCHSCGATNAAWSAAERHADQPGHHRIDLILVRRDGR